MSKRKTALSAVVAFLLTLVLCGWALVGTALVTLYQPDFISKNIDDRYADSVYSSLMLQWETIGGPSGLPEDVMNGVIGREFVAVAVQEYTRELWGGNAAHAVPTEAVKQKLMDAFIGYAERSDYVVDEDVTTALSATADACVTAYVRHVNIPALRAASKLVTQSKQLVQLLFLALSFLLAALVFLSVRLHRYWFHSTRDMVYTLLATGLVLAPPSVLVLVTDPMSKINLSPAYLRWLLSDAVDSVMWCLLIVAMVCTVLGVVLLVISEKMHHKTFHREQREPGALVMANARRYSRLRRKARLTENSEENPRHGRKNENI